MLIVGGLLCVNYLNELKVAALQPWVSKLSAAQMPSPNFLVVTWHFQIQSSTEIQFNHILLNRD